MNRTDNRATRAINVNDWDAYIAQRNAARRRGRSLPAVLLGALTGFASAIVGLAFVSLLWEAAAWLRGCYEDSFGPRRP
jgi:hypothetical protein